MTSNVYLLRPRRLAPPVSRLPIPSVAGVFDALTDRLVMTQAAAGTLNPGIVAALLAAVRHPSGEVGR